jgi:hypothetical protein
MVGGGVVVEIAVAVLFLQIGTFSIYMYIVFLFTYLHGRLLGILHVLNYNVNSSKDKMCERYTVL